MTLTDHFVFPHVVQLFIFLFMNHNGFLEWAGKEARWTKTKARAVSTLLLKIEFAVL